MRADRKAARDYVQSIKTREELENYLDMLNLTDEQKQIGMMMFSKGWSRAKIAMETGYSPQQLKRIIRRIYDRMV